MPRDSSEVGAKRSVLEKEVLETVVSLPEQVSFQVPKLLLPNEQKGLVYALRSGQLPFPPPQSVEL